MLESVLGDAGWLPSLIRLSDAFAFCGDAESGGELASEDLSERRVKENELSLRLCLGMSTVGLETSDGPSTPVLTM